MLLWSFSKIMQKPKQRILSACSVNVKVKVTENSESDSYVISVPLWHHHVWAGQSMPRPVWAGNTLPRPNWAWHTLPSLVWAGLALPRPLFGKKISEKHWPRVTEIIYGLQLNIDIKCYLCVHKITNLLLK